MLRIAQISDLHVSASASQALSECIARVNAVAPDFVIATGDLVDSGTENEYRCLRELVSALSCPYFVMPGNHDDARALRRVFSDHAYLFQTGAHVSYTIDAGGLSVIALDSTKHRRPGGYLDAERLTWLDSQLEERTDAPVVLALHHPPFATGVWPMDWLGFRNVRKLEETARRNPQIQRIVSGHVHCARIAAWGGTVACTSPAIIPQRLLLGVGWKVPKLHFEQPGFLLHAWDGGALLTQVHRMAGTIESL